MTKISLKLDLRKTSIVQGDKHPLVLQLSHNQKTRLIYLDINLNKSDFNPSSLEKPISKKILGSSRLNARCKTSLSRAQLFVQDNNKRIKYWDINRVKVRIEKEVFGKVNEKGFLSFSSNYLKRLKEEGRYSTASSYEDSLKAFVRFLKKKRGNDDVEIDKQIKSLFDEQMTLLDEFETFDIPCESIDREFVLDLRSFFKSRYSSKNTPNIFLRSISAILNEAYKSIEDLNGYSPINDIKTPSFRNIPTPLSGEELLKLNSYKTSVKGLEESKNYFLFMFYCMGMNFTDLALLEKWNVNGGKLLYTRRKTRNSSPDNFSITLSSQALDILNASICKNGSKYLFPILKDDIPEDKVHAKIKEKIIYFNKQIKKVAHELGIDKNITSYTPRDTWTAMGSEIGIDLRLLSKGFGHSSMDTTDKHYAPQLNGKILDEVNSRIASMIM